MASDRLRARFVSCTSSDPACVTSSIEAAGLRLFRRPLAPEELQTYQRVYECGARAGRGRARRVHAGAAGAAVERGVSLPHRARSRVPNRPRPPARPVRAGVAPVVLSLEQRARRRLARGRGERVLAERGRCLRPPSIACSHDPKSERFVANFAGQWLGAREVLSHPVAPKFFQWSPADRAGRRPGDPPLFLRLPAERAFVVRVPDGGRQLRGRRRSRYFYGMPSDRQGGRQVRAGRIRRRQARRLLRPGRVPGGDVVRPTHVALASRALDREQPAVQGSAAAAARTYPSSRRSTGAATSAQRSTFERAWSSIAQDPGCAALPCAVRSVRLGARRVRRHRPLSRGLRRMARRWTPRPRCRRRHRTPTAWSSRGSTGSRRPSRPTRASAACLAREAPHLRSGADDDRRRRPVTSSRRDGEWLEPGQTPSIRRLIHALVSTQAVSSPPRRRRSEAHAMIRAFTRRGLLCGAGVALALPWLESLSPRRSRAQAAELPRALSADLSAERGPRLLAARDQRQRRRLAAVLDPRAVRCRAQGEAERRHQPRERLGLQRRRLAARRAAATAVWRARG